MEKVEPKYIMKLETINKTTIKDYFIYEEERRRIRWGKVSSMVVQFSKKDNKERHFDAPISINQINNKKTIKRVIDGNHRIEAIKEKLNRNKDFEVKVWMAVYKNLSREQERMIYTKLNKGTPENATDFLKWHFKTIPYGEEMLRRLPATVYGSERKMQLKNLVGSHINAKKQNKFEGGYSAGGEKTVSDFKTITNDDITIIKAFCKDMEEVFGRYFKKCPYYGTTPIQSFYRIWYDNRKQISRPNFIKAFKDVFLNKWGELNELSGHGGISATKTFYKLSIYRLNDYRKRLYFLSDKDLEDTSEQEMQQLEPPLPIIPV